MKRKIYTLEVKEKVKIKHLASISEEVVLEVDYTNDGFIIEIRVWSEYFGGFVPVTEVWLKNNEPRKLATIYNAVSVDLSDRITGKKEKEYEPENEIA